MKTKAKILSSTSTKKTYLILESNRILKQANAASYLQKPVVCFSGHQSSSYCQRRGLALFLEVKQFAPLLLKDGRNFSLVLSHSIHLPSKCASFIILYCRSTTASGTCRDCSEDKEDIGLQGVQRTGHNPKCIPQP